MKHVLFCVAVAAASIVAPTLPGQNMIGITWGGSIYNIDANTGTSAMVGSSGFNTTNSMAVTNGTLVTMQNGGTMIAIDPTTGSGSLIATFPQLLSVRGLATDPSSGALYAIRDGGFTNGIANPDSLYRIDVANSSATYLGDANHGGLQGFAIDSTGNAYAWDTGPGTGPGEGLVAMDLATGATFDVNPSIGGTSTDVQCLTFTPNGTLLGARYQLYSIDPNTGQQAPVGGGNFGDLRGIEFDTQATATCTLRNGSGANPSTCSCQTLPRLGTSWFVDVQGTPNSVATFCLVSSTALPGIAVPGLGEVMIGNPLAAMFNPSPFTFFMPIPAASSFSGFRVTAQGMLLNTGPNGLSFQLTNAIEGVVGQ